MSLTNINKENQICFAINKIVNWKVINYPSLLVRFYAYTNQSQLSNSKNKCLLIENKLSIITLFKNQIHFRSKFNIKFTSSQHLLVMQLIEIQQQTGKSNRQKIIAEFQLNLLQLKDNGNHYFLFDNNTKLIQLVDLNQFKPQSNTLLSKQYYQQSSKLPKQISQLHNIHKNNQSKYSFFKIAQSTQSKQFFNFKKNKIKTEKTENQQESQNRLGSPNKFEFLLNNQNKDKKLFKIKNIDPTSILTKKVNQLNYRTSQCVSTEQSIPYQTPKNRQIKPSMEKIKLARLKHSKSQKSYSKRILFEEDEEQITLTDHNITNHISSIRKISTQKTLLLKELKVITKQEKNNRILAQRPSIKCESIKENYNNIHICF